MTSYFTLLFIEWKGGDNEKKQGGILHGEFFHCQSEVRGCAVFALKELPAPGGGGGIGVLYCGPEKGKKSALHGTTTLLTLLASPGARPCGAWVAIIWFFNVLKASSPAQFNVHAQRIIMSCTFWLPALGGGAPTS